jgi:hypothetical protein
MGSMRIFRRLLPAGLFLLWIVQPAFADGLAQFEKLIKPQLPPGSLTYKSAEALGDNGFVLEGVTVTEPAEGGEKKQPVAIKKLTVEDFDFAGFQKDQTPTFIKARAEGIAVGANPADGVDLKELLGIDHVDADIGLDYRLDPAKKTMSLNRLDLTLNGLGRLDLSLTLDGVDPDAAKGDKAMDDAVLRSASLTFEDHSLLGKIVPAIAKMQGSEPAATIAMAKIMLASVGGGQGQATQAAVDALASFLDDYRQPKGPLKLTVKPQGKVSGAELKNASPDEVIKTLGLSVSYAGTVPHPASAVKQ